MASDADFEIIKTNYNTIHDSVQNAHKIAWSLTSIFISVAFASIALVVKESNSFIIKIIVLCGSIILIWFWNKLLEFLNQLNDIRFERLRQIEEYINSVGSFDGKYQFSYYNHLKEVLDGKEEKDRIRFKTIIKTFSWVYYILVGALIISLSIIELLGR